MDTEGGLEVGHLVEVVFEALPQGVTVRSVEVCLHLGLAYLTISAHT